MIPTNETEDKAIRSHCFFNIDFHHEMNLIYSIRDKYIKFFLVFD